MEKANVFTVVAVEKYSCCDICLKPPRRAAKATVAVHACSRLVKSVMCVTCKRIRQLAKKSPAGQVYFINPRTLIVSRKIYIVRPTV